MLVEAQDGAESTLSTLDADIDQRSRGGVYGFEVAKEMLKWGFKRGRYNPCLYWNPSSGLATPL